MKVLITGASSGIGKDLSREFAKRKYEVILVARSENKLKELKEPLEKEVMPLMGRAQGEVFAKLDELDEGTKEHIKAIKEFHEAEIEEHKKASEVQALCKRRIDLVKENLSKLEF